MALLVMSVSGEDSLFDNFSVGGVGGIRTVYYFGFLFDRRNSRHEGVLVPQAMSIWRLTRHTQPRCPPELHETTCSD